MSGVRYELGDLSVRREDYDEIVEGPTVVIERGEEVIVLTIADAAWLFGISGPACLPPRPSAEQERRERHRR